MNTPLLELFVRALLSFVSQASWVLVLAALVPACAAPGPGTGDVETGGGAGSSDGGAPAAGGASGASAQGGLGGALVGGGPVAGASGQGC